MDVVSPPNELAYCGLYCGGCPLYQATAAGTLEAEAARGISAEQLRCLGCRSEKVSVYCLNCSMKKCAARQRLTSCADCGDFPCRVLEAFDDDGYPPHHGVVASLRFLRARGIDAWLRAHAERFACACGGLLSNRDEACPACGRAVASASIA